MAQSRFVNLTSYCMAEYMAEPLGSANYYTDNFVLVENAKTDSNQIFNEDSSYHTTKNIQDLTVAPIGNNSFVYLDSEKIPDYLAYDSDLTTTSVTGYNVVMDKVRFHFVSGFEFDQFVALVLSVSHTENNGKKSLFANILLAPETIAELIIFNSKPLFVANALYDRYIDILVPSIKNINEDYKIAAVPANTFVAAITPNATSSNGFIYNNPIEVGLAECSKKKTLATGTSTNYDSYEVSEVYTATVSQSNEFDNVGAYVNESAVGDYIEFYLTFNSGFPEELISILNRRNPADDWIIIHQLSVFEQIGSAFINTTRQIFFQEDSYDEANIFRPVLKNANQAVSMSIDLISRLTNRRDGEQIIREASFNLTSPKKYGKKLNVLPILDKPGSQTVYNKILKNTFEATNLFIQPNPISNSNQVSQNSTVTEVVRTEYIPIFFNNNNISISQISGLVSTSDATEEIVFGPGKLRFILSPFDNLLKFKVYTKSSSTSAKTLIPLDLNINAAKYKVVFETNSGKVSIENTGDSQLENLSTGVVAFNVSKKESESIIGSKIRTVYLTSVAQDGKETFMYSGEWRKTNEQSEVDAALNLVIAESAKEKNLQSILDKINAANADSVSQLDRSSANALSAILARGVASTVNKFGIKSGKSIRTSNKNLISGIVSPPNKSIASSVTGLTRKQVKHTVAKGETIKTVALQYGVSVESIKNANDLSTNEITPGQILIIIF